MNKKKTIKTWLAFIIWAVLMSGAYIFTGFKASAQFDAYALWLTIGLASYTGKRLFQKKKEFKNNEDK